MRFTQVSNSRQEALEIAADYTVSCIRETMEHDQQKKYGVNFELMLPQLLHRLGH